MGCMACLYFFGLAISVCRYDYGNSELNLAIWQDDPIALKLPLRTRSDGGNRCSDWIANDPGHNQSVDVSYFAQTPDGQRRNRNTNRYAIAKRSVFISTC
jgi:hypothetical protein